MQNHGKHNMGLEAILQNTTQHNTDIKYTPEIDF